MEQWWVYVILGLVSGVFSATFGVGSGIIMVPAMVLLLSVPQKSAQGICLAAMVPIALVGAMRYKLNPAIEVDMRLVGVLAAGGVMGALVGASIASVASAPVLRKLFAVVMIVMAVRLLATSAGGPVAPGPADVVQNREGEPSPAAPGEQ